MKLFRNLFSTFIARTPYHLLVKIMDIKGIGTLVTWSEPAEVPQQPLAET